MLIFDYDGVLLDSVREIAVTAYNMLKGTIVTRLDQLPKMPSNCSSEIAFMSSPLATLRC